MKQKKPLDSKDLADMHNEIYDLVAEAKHDSRVFFQDLQLKLAKLANMTESAE